MMKEPIVSSLEDRATKLDKQGEDSVSAKLMRAAALEIERLRTTLDSRPAINLALPQSYIDWSRGIYLAETLHATQTSN